MLNWILLYKYSSETFLLFLEAEITSIKPAKVFIANNLFHWFHYNSVLCICLQLWNCLLHVLCMNISIHLLCTGYLCQLCLWLFSSLVQSSWHYEMKNRHCQGLHTESDRLLL